MFLIFVHVVDSCSAWVRLELLTMVTVRNTVFWDVVACVLVEIRLLPLWLTAYEHA